MDVEVKCTLTDDPKSLIDSITECKKTLTKLCFAKYGSAKITDFEVFATQKVCDFLLLAEHVVPKEKLENYYFKRIAELEQFQLFRCKGMDGSHVKIVTKFDVGEGMPKHWYGNITLG